MVLNNYKNRMCKMIEMDVGKMDLAEVKALMEITEQFVAFAERLLEKEDISQEEYHEMTYLKKEFLQDVQTRYL